MEQMKILKRKLCPACHQRKLYYRNGLPISKYCSFCKKQKELEKKEKHLKTKGAQESLRKRLHKKAWKLMSEWVRRRYAKNGHAQCYTCNVLLPWKKLHAGHYLHNRLDLDERNIRQQCEQCNYYKSGALAIYGVNLVHELGLIKVEELILDANTKGNRYEIFELETIIIDLEQKLKKLDERN